MVIFKNRSFLIQALCDRPGVVRIKRSIHRKNTMRKINLYRIIDLVGIQYLSLREISERHPEFETGRKLKSHIGLCLHGELRYTRHTIAYAGVTDGRAGIGHDA